MFAGDMRKTYALSLIDKMPPLPKGRPFPRIARDAVVAGLRDRVNDPRKQNQSAASLCGPAAFFYCVLNYKPELYVQYVIDLFTTGKARIGSLMVEPSLGCRAYDPGARLLRSIGLRWLACAIPRTQSWTTPQPMTRRPALPARLHWQIGYELLVTKASATTRTTIFARVGKKSRPSLEIFRSAAMSACSSTTTYLRYRQTN